MTDLATQLKNLSHKRETILPAEAPELGMKLMLIAIVLMLVGLFLFSVDAPLLLIYLLGAAFAAIGIYLFTRKPLVTHIDFGEQRIHVEYGFWIGPIKIEHIAFSEISKVFLRKDDPIFRASQQQYALFVERKSWQMKIAVSSDYEHLNQLAETFSSQLAIHCEAVKH